MKYILSIFFIIMVGCQQGSDSKSSKDTDAQQLSKESDRLEAMQLSENLLTELETVLSRLSDAEDAEAIANSRDELRDFVEIHKSIDMTYVKESQTNLLELDLPGIDPLIEEGRLNLRSLLNELILPDGRFPDDLERRIREILESLHKAIKILRKTTGHILLGIGGCGYCMMGPDVSGPGYPDDTCDILTKPLKAPREKLGVACIHAACEAAGGRIDIVDCDQDRRLPIEMQNKHCKTLHKTTVKCNGDPDVIPIIRFDCVKVPGKKLKPIKGGPGPNLCSKVAARPKKGGKAPGAGPGAGGPDPEPPAPNPADGDGDEPDADEKEDIDYTN